MSIDIRLPNITATTEEGKLQQMQSYMYQLVGQLNWALNTVESAQNGNTTAVVFQQREGVSQAISQKDAEETFNSIKNLIIKSADIVKAYEDTIRTNFKGEYFAESDFGTFVKDTNRFVEENSRGVTEAYEIIESIDKDMDGVKEYIKTTNGYIHRGELDDGSIGIEIGETTDYGYRRYAQFTSDRLTFYDVNGNPVAYIGAGDADKSDTNRLYVNGRAVFLDAVQFRGYVMDSSDGLAFTWIG